MNSTKVPKGVDASKVKNLKKISKQKKSKQTGSNKKMNSRV